jgi:hypothetical protein
MVGGGTDSRPLNKRVVMTKNEIFELYKRVQQKDRQAEDQLIAEHKKKYPDDMYHKYPQLYDRKKNNRFRDDLHIMYLHLYR